MTTEEHLHSAELQDSAPGDEHESESHIAGGISGYVLGLALAILLTAASFWAVQTHLIYGPGIPVALVTFAIAQMGIHLVFFLHLTTAPDNENNILALAFGILIVFLVVFGSIWIMDHLNYSMMPTGEVMQMQ
jgi:cytochrome o ubiquinol oxidase operon protein cyoD